MKQKIVLFFIANIIICSLWAQGGQRQRAQGEMPTFIIKGQLIEEVSGEPVEFATVSVFSERDSSLVTGGLTDEEGNFNIESRPGRLFIVVQFMGYKTVKISGVVLGRETRSYDAGKVNIKQDERLLDEVVVQGERTQMELTLDKKIYNIGKDLSNLGGSTADLLANLPSVEVDVDGNVSLRGSENVQIMIDGKPSGIIGLSGSGGLQQLQGNMVESVEIITNPSARYDAEGGAGIVNIILKKEEAKGFNGSFQVQAGLPANNGASVNINYRTGWINWFVNYGVTYRESPGEGFTNNSFNNSAIDTIYFIDQINDRNRTGLSQNLRFGSDIYFNPKNVLTLSASYRNSDDENITETDYLFLNRNRILFADRLRIDNEDENDLNWQYELLFNRDFERKGQKFSANFQYRDSEETEVSAFDDVTTFVSGTVDNLIQNSRNNNGENQVLAQLDYIHPFLENAKFEVGFRYTNRNIFNDYEVESDSTGDGEFEEVVGLTNDFNFEEQVFAGYGMLSNKKDRFSWQVGFRLEQTDLETLLKAPTQQQDSSNNQSYLSFFPSANVTYKYSEISSLQLSYSRRISRPSFRNLNPFLTYSNPLSLYTGNPTLQPQFTDSYELGILQNREATSIYAGLYYRHTTDVVQRIQVAGEGEGVTIRRPENLAVEDAIGLETNINHDFTKQFRITSNVNFYHSKIDGGELLSVEATTVSGRLGAFYRNSKFINAQATWWYRAPQNIPQGTRASISSLDVGLSRDVLKNNGTLALSVTDLFNSRKYRGETTTETFTSESQFQRRVGPTAVLSFTYRLNQKKKREGRGGSRDEGGFDGGEF